MTLEMRNLSTIPFSRSSTSEKTWYPRGHRLSGRRKKRPRDWLDDLVKIRITRGSKRGTSSL